MFFEFETAMVWCSGPQALLSSHYAPSQVGPTGYFAGRVRHPSTQSQLGRRSEFCKGHPAALTVLVKQTPQARPFGAWTGFSGIGAPLLELGDGKPRF
jgi:hypothetical protein